MWLLYVASWILQNRLEGGYDDAALADSPRDARAAAAPLPTIVTFTPYNKNTNNLVPLGGGVNAYLVSHGYNHVVVDVRGTGRSGGAWDPFSAREQQDYPQVLDWVAAQPWSNGVI